MSELTNYIKERIAKLEKIREYGRDVRTIDFALDQLQAVLSKIEELKTNK